MFIAHGNTHFNPFLGGRLNNNNNNNQKTKSESLSFFVSSQFIALGILSERTRARAGKRSWQNRYDFFSAPKKIVRQYFLLEMRKSIVFSVFLRPIWLRAINMTSQKIASCLPHLSSTWSSVCQFMHKILNPAMKVFMNKQTNKVCSNRLSFVHFLSCRKFFRYLVGHFHLVFRQNWRRSNIGKSAT